MTVRGLQNRIKRKWQQSQLSRGKDRFLVKNKPMFPQKMERLKQEIGTRRGQYQFKTSFLKICKSLTQRWKRWWLGVKIRYRVEDTWPIFAKFVERRATVSTLETTLRQIISKEFPCLVTSVKKPSGQETQWGNINVKIKSNTNWLSDVSNWIFRARQNLRAHKAKYHWIS